MHILQASRGKKSDQALFETCNYLAARNTTALEDDWLSILAEIGMSPSIGQDKVLWIQCVHDVKMLVDADELDITDALVCTTKLYLLYQRIAGPVTDSIAKLRERVIDQFPTDSRLSYKGINLFESILPEETDANKEIIKFCHRILSGFIKLFYDKNPVTPEAIEFIARKKVSIPLKSVWPAPSPQEAAKQDPVWLVWGAMLLYFPNDLYVSASWALFSHNWRRKYKNERLGLLVGAAACAVSNNQSELVHTSWSRDEAGVIDNIQNLAADLWASHSPPPPATVGGSAAGFSLDQFIPRRTLTEDSEGAGGGGFVDDGDTDILMKVINIKAGKK